MNYEDFLRNERRTFERFEKLLNDYFASENLVSSSVPSATFCAEKRYLSPNYFGDLVKKETKKTAQEYIQYKIIGIANERIF